MKLFFVLGLVACAIVCAVELTLWQAMKAGGWAGVMLAGCFAAWADSRKQCS